LRRVPGDPEADSETSETDFLDAVAAGSGYAAESAGKHCFDRQQSLALMERALEKLPARQREAFLLRYWEGLEAVTFKKQHQVMGCSEGSVKTHCSRAVQSLSGMLLASAKALIHQSIWSIATIIDANLKTPIPAARRKPQQYNELTSSNTKTNPQQYNELTARRN
jgi:hypothetical protein